MFGPTGRYVHSVFVHTLNMLIEIGKNLEVIVVVVPISLIKGVILIRNFQPYHRLRSQHGM